MDQATSATSGIPAWFQSAASWLAPTLAVIVGYFLTSWNSKRTAEKVEKKLEKTNEENSARIQANSDRIMANTDKLERIHRLVNGGRLGDAFRRIDDLERQLYERGIEPVPRSDPEKPT